MSVLTTQRLVLRPFREGDAEPMFRNWMSDEDVARYCRWYRHKDLKSSQWLLQQYLKEAADGFHYRWCVNEKGREEAIGCVEVVGLREHKTCAEIGYVIAKRFWNQGYMTEAVAAIIRELFRSGFHKVLARHHADNPASGRVAEKCGMHFVGWEQELHKPDSDILCDMQVHAIHKDDYEPERIVHG